MHIAQNYILQLFFRLSLVLNFPQNFRLVFLLNFSYKKKSVPHCEWIFKFEQPWLTAQSGKHANSQPNFEKREMKRCVHVCKHIGTAYNMCKQFSSGEMFTIICVS